MLIKRKREKDGCYSGWIKAASISVQIVFFSFFLAEGQPHHVKAQLPFWTKKTVQPHNYSNRLYHLHPPPFLAFTFCKSTLSNRLFLVHRIPGGWT